MELRTKKALLLDEKRARKLLKLAIDIYANTMYHMKLQKRTEMKEAETKSCPFRLGIGKQK